MILAVFPLHTIAIAIWCPDLLGTYLNTSRAASYHVTTGLKSIHHGESEAVGGDGDVSSMFTSWKVRFLRTDVFCAHQSGEKTCFITCFNITLLWNQGGEVVDFIPTCAASDQPLNTTPGRDVNFLQSPVGWPISVVSPLPYNWKNQITNLKFSIVIFQLPFSLEKLIWIFDGSYLFHESPIHIPSRSHQISKNDFWRSSNEQTIAVPNLDNADVLPKFLAPAFPHFGLVPLTPRSQLPLNRNVLLDFDMASNGSPCHHKRWQVSP